MSEPQEPESEPPEMDVLDALADMWAEEVNLTAMIKNVVSPMRLNPNVPQRIRDDFTARMESQISAICRLTFVEALVRHAIGVKWEVKPTSPPRGTR